MSHSPRTRPTRYLPIALTASAIGLLLACGEDATVPDAPDSGPDSSVIGTSGTSGASGMSTTSSGSTSSSSSSTSSSSSSGELDAAADATEASSDAAVMEASVDADASEPEPTTCDPQKVPDYTFKPMGPYLGKCTKTALAVLYEACIGENNTIPACDQAMKAREECASCAFGPATGIVQHPWVVHDAAVTAFPNYGLCMAVINGETKPTECGIAYGQFYTCLGEACTTPCADTGSPDAYDACRTTAYTNGYCDKGAGIALSKKCSFAYEETNPTYGFCTSTKDENGNQMSDEQYMIALANLVCGAKPKFDGGAEGGIK